VNGPEAQDSVQAGEDAIATEWRARRGRFAAEAEVLDSRPLRWLLGAVGGLSLGLGILGVILPVLPTTPFVILSAACFFRSSPRFYGAVLDNRVLGPLVYRWRRERTIPPRAKAVAVTLIAVTLGLSIAFVVKPLPLRLMLAGIGVIVSVWLLSVPSRR